MIETLDKKITGLLLYRSEIYASCGTLSLDSLVFPCDIIVRPQ